MNGHDRFQFPNCFILSSGLLSHCLCEPGQPARANEKIQALKAECRRIAAPTFGGAKGDLLCLFRRLGGSIAPPVPAGEASPLQQPGDVPSWLWRLADHSLRLQVPLRSLCQPVDFRTVFALNQRLNYGNRCRLQKPASNAELTGTIERAAGC